MKNFRARTISNLILRTFGLVSLVFFLSAFTNNSTESLAYKSNSQSTMNLSGYSKLNNWAVGFKNINSEGSFIMKNKELDEISALEFSVSTSMLKGDDAAVDSVLHTLLVDGKAQTISFKLTRQMVLPIMKKVQLLGEFTFAGVTRYTSLQMSFEVDADNHIILKGTNTILLSDFICSATRTKLKGLKCNDQLTFALELNLQPKS